MLNAGIEPAWYPYEGCVLPTKLIQHVPLLYLEVEMFTPELDSGIEPEFELYQSSVLTILLIQRISYTVLTYLSTR